MIQGGLDPNMVKTFSPDDAGSNTHECIKKEPNRCEQPVRWIKTWFVQGQIPTIDRALRGKTRKKTNQQANSDSNNYFNDFFFMVVLFLLK